MNCVEYLVRKMVEYGARDVFGVPGGVVLDFVYAVEADPRLRLHLSYHEQGAGFEAAGYAQVSNRLGVAYATRGPGFTNMVTPIVEAYQESIPILCITAHAADTVEQRMRMYQDQEIDAIAMIQHVTKYARRLDDIAECAEAIDVACREAMGGRKGPVVLDFHASLFTKQIPNQNYSGLVLSDDQVCLRKINDARRAICHLLNTASRPLVLLGEGARGERIESHVEKFIRELRIPVLTSRGSQDILKSSDLQFGYIGSHGIRYSNYIFAKSDAIVSFGNRMSFPLDSESYKDLFLDKKVIRIDIDPLEFDREIPHSESFCVGLNSLFKGWDWSDIKRTDEAWFETCSELAELTNDDDIFYPVSALARIISSALPYKTIVVDVGNHEFWVSRAYEASKSHTRIIYSRSFGTLGCAIPRAIGAYYGSKSPVVCFVGDQGFQFNVQELQMIGNARLPILIILLNNRSSGMIRSRQQEKYGGNFLLTTEQSGYGNPDYESIARAYNIGYTQIERGEDVDRFFQVIRSSESLPLIAEFVVNDDVPLGTYLPKGHAIEELNPPIEKELRDYIESL